MSLLKKLHQFILRRGRRTDFVAPPSQIAADMLCRRASSLHLPRSQTEQPQFFKRLLGWSMNEMKRILVGRGSRDEGRGLGLPLHLRKYQIQPESKRKTRAVEPLTLSLSRFGRGEGTARDVTMTLVWYLISTKQVCRLAAVSRGFPALDPRLSTLHSPNIWLKGACIAGQGYLDSAFLFGKTGGRSIVCRS